MYAVSAGAGDDRSAGPESLDLDPAGADSLRQRAPSQFCAIVVAAHAQKAL